MADRTGETGAEQQPVVASAAAMATVVAAATAAAAAAAAGGSGGGARGAGRRGPVRTLTLESPSAPEHLPPAPPPPPPPPAGADGGGEAGDGGVQETDGSFFESFTALAWKQENRKLLALQEAEQRADALPPAERPASGHGHGHAHSHAHSHAHAHAHGLAHGPSPGHADYHIPKKELEQLYVEVLYTIANKVGASTGQYAHYKEELFSYAKEAFGIPNDVHRRLLAVASEEKPPIVVLNVVVMEAEGLEAKDANETACTATGTSVAGCMRNVACESQPVRRAWNASGARNCSQPS